MKALTIRQPWAWAIAAGHKTVENRTWGTNYRGPLAIHAGRQFDQWARNSAPIRHAAREAYDRGEVDNPGGVLYGDELPAGAVVAVAELVDVHLADDCCRPWGDSLPPSGAQRQRVRHWVLGGVRQLAEPVPATGWPGLWDVELPASAIGGAP